MPAAINYLQPNDRARETLGGDTERKERTRLYERNLNYNEGKQRKWLIQEADDPVDDNITINVTKQTVDRTLSFLFPDMPILQLDPNGTSPTEIWLNAAFRYNGGAFFLSSLGHKGALSGHNYVKVLPPVDGSEFPRMVSMNPVVPITFWRADDPGIIVWHELRWTVGKQEMLQDYINMSDHWIISQWQRATGRGAWSRMREDIVWDNTIPPIIAWPHMPDPDSYYGKGEISDNSIMLNDSINRVASDIGKILRYHASPRTIAIGVTSAEIKQSGISKLWTIQNENAKVINLEMQSDLASSTAFLQFLNDMFLAQARVVIMRGTVKDFQRVTNTGIRAVFLDMIAKNELLRWTYGTGLQNIAQAVLVLGNKTVGQKPTITWTDPLPSDELEEVNKLDIEQRNGWISPESASKLLGHEWETETLNWTGAMKLEFIQKLLFSKSQATSARAAQTNTNKVPV